MADGVPDGYGNVRVSFSGSRNVTQSDKDNATITVYFNGKQVEKNGNVFEDRVSTGTRLTITAEAVNGGRIVGKGEETITVRGGNNNVSMQVYTYDNFVVTIDGKATGYTNFDDAWDSASGKTATIKMNADATNVSVTLSSGNVTLDLNGHTLNGNGSTNVMKINGGTLTLNDSGSSGKITGSGATQYNSDGGGVYVNTGAIFIMNGGAITGNTNRTVGYGGGVFNKGTFTMNAGTINGNIVEECGGGVYISGGTFTMNGGTISNNEASVDVGGGVAISDSGTFTMNGGAISGNIAAIEGGGVSVSSGTFTMNGGSITGNTGQSAGGVCNLGTFTMNNGIISGNTGDAGGVSNESDSATFTMKGGTISGNTATGYGGGIFIYKGIFVKTGGTVRGNTAPSGGGSQLYVGLPGNPATPDKPVKYDLGDGNGEKTITDASTFALDTAF